MATTKAKTTIKTGIVVAGSFSGTPKTYTVTFATAYFDNNYDIQITGVDARSWSYTKNANGVGFVINTNANASLTGEVSWTTCHIGEQ